MPICARMTGRASNQGQSCWTWDADFLLRLPLKRRRPFQNGESLARIRLLKQYLLYDERENYACLDQTGRLRYFQAGRPEEFLRLYSDRDATIQHFSQAFAQLLPSLPTDDGTLSTAEHGGRRLVRHPLSAYERSNLTFVQGRIWIKRLAASGSRAQFQRAHLLRRGFSPRGGRMGGSGSAPGRTVRLRPGRLGIPKCSLFRLPQRGRPASGEGICLRRGNSPSFRLVCPAR